MKKFDEWLNESFSSDWENIFKNTEKKMLSSLYGLSDLSPDEKIFNELLKSIRSGNIYGNRILSYPFVLAITEVGNSIFDTGAWKIKDEKDFFRWFLTVNPYFRNTETISKNVSVNIGDFINTLKVHMSTHDNLNGHRIDFFQTVEEMKSLERESREKYECDNCGGSGESDEEPDEECELCDGTGVDSVPSQDILDGKFFPSRTLNKW